ncbi:Chromosome 5 4 [Thoreauomyces humboldtii]|nr:Chromosome 5 4 [Thoreauomyces humboldtii]
MTVQAAARPETSQHERDVAEAEKAASEWGPVVKHIKAAFDPTEVTFYAIFITAFFTFLGRYGEKTWSYLLANYSQQTLFFGGTFLITQLGYWFWASVLSVLDLYQFPKSFWRYKIQPTKVPTWEWYTRAVSVVLQNQLLVGIPTGILMYNLMMWRGCSFGMDLPTLGQVGKQSIGFLAVEEILFYYGHRALHHPSVYKYVHKKHHLYTAPIGIAAIYCHPLEHFMCNLAPLLLGPILMKSHLLTVWLWMTIGQTNAINSHSGFHLPFFPSPLPHDYHHEVFNVNFGPLGVLDWLHDTAGSREKTLEAKQRRAAAKVE